MRLDVRLAGISDIRYLNEVIGYRVKYGALEKKYKYFFFKDYLSSSVALDKSIKFRKSKIKSGEIIPVTGVTLTNHKAIYKYFSKDGEMLGYKFSIMVNRRCTEKWFSFSKFGDDALKEAVNFKNIFLLKSPIPVGGSMRGQNGTNKRWPGLPVGVTIYKRKTYRNVPCERIAYKVSCCIGNYRREIVFMVDNPENLTLSNVRLARKKAIACRLEFLKYKALGLTFDKSNKDY